MNIRTLSNLVVASALSFVAACAQSPTEGGTIEIDPERLNWSKQAALQTATSCEEARQMLTDVAVTGMRMQIEQQRRQWHEFGPMVSYGGMDGTTGGDDGAEMAASSESSGNDYSETNTQVQGVDEADLVKTDGDRIFTIAGKDLVIVQAWPAAETKELSRVTVPGNPHSMYLMGDRVAVLSWSNLHDHTPAGQRELEVGGEGYYDYYSNWRYVTLVTLVDVTDLAQPRVLRTTAYDGYSLNTRRIGDKMYLVQQTWPRFDGVTYWPEELHYEASGDEIDATFARLSRRNEEIIRARTLDQWLPKTWTLDEGLTEVDAGEIATSCDGVHAPSVYSGEGMVTVYTIDLTEGEAAADSILGNWGQIYASPEALYVASTNWDYIWWWTTSAKSPEVKTHIHKFSLQGDGRARYAASGAIEGWVLNQFSMDEHEGDLRVAATSDFGWWFWDDEQDEIDSAVTVLREDAGVLKPVGYVDGLGKGEQIYSVRFMGDKGYVVTFRQVDPLYVLDLSDATRPLVRGELKVPGFSSYIHPLDDGHLLTIGRDATDEGQVKGVQLQIFDVRDPAAPTQKHKLSFGDDWHTYTEAQWDHHAFTYYAKKGLLAIPVQTWGDYWEGSNSTLNLFQIDLETGIQAAGQVHHNDFMPEASPDCGYYGYGWESRVRRGVFIEDYLYSLSTLGLKVHDADALDAGALASLKLSDSMFESPDWCYYAE